MEKNKFTETVPDTAKNLYYKGIFHFRNGGLEEALTYFNRVLEIIPSHAYCYYFIGFIWGIKADYQKAGENLLKAISLKGDEPDFYNRLGLVFAAEGKSAPAIENFKKALQLASNHEYYHNLALVFHKKGMLPEALENYFEAVKLEQNNYTFLNNLGVALCESNRHEEAIEFFSRATALNKENPEYFNNLGLALSHIKPEKIVDLLDYHRDTSSNPDFYNIFRREYLKKLDLAAQSYQKAIELNPENPDYYNNLGIILQKMDDFASAGKNYLKAIALNPENAQYYNNQALIYEETGEYQQAIKFYKKALELAPGKKKVYSNLSLAYLRLENFAAGWENFERSRNSRKGKLRELYDKPEWNGEDIRGKTIYVCGEQGLGDTLHYIRYLPLLKERGANVIFNCQPGLADILKTAKGFDLIVSGPVDGEIYHFDTFVLLMSLCRIFTPGITSIPANIPYIFSSGQLKEKWAEKFKNEKRLKIGFVWRARYSNQTFNKRSCPLEKFAGLAETFPDIMFYSLQKGPFEAEINKFSLPNLKSLSSEISDFTDSAAILEHLDLLISIDTSVVHLGGALGKKVWNLLPFSADWRWFLGRDDSPWYPSMRLFRQNRPGDWDSVFAEVAEALKVLHTPQPPLKRW